MDINSKSCFKFIELKNDKKLKAKKNIHVKMSTL